jgi:hypothetical protein
MIEERRSDSWVLGDIERPFGRGMNLQIECSDVRALRNRATAAGLNLYKELHDAWYQVADAMYGQRQFVIADPDGYLLRFCQHIGDRELDV